MLLGLAEAITGGVSLEALQPMVTGRRVNAQRTLTAEDWRAQVDGYLEVWADARLSPERER